MPGAEAEADDLPISALQHYVYCPRQCALIHLERLWAEDRATAEGRILHAAADQPGMRGERGRRVARALPLRSGRLAISGVADVVEFTADDAGWQPFPVEYKRGRPKGHRADEIQLCAQALCLEEMTGRTIPAGALFYGQTRRRQAVDFDDALRRLTEETIAAVWSMLRAARTPPPVNDDRCPPCSLLAICQPAMRARRADRWLAGLIDETE